MDTAGNQKILTSIRKLFFGISFGFPFCRMKNFPGSPGQYRNRGGLQCGKYLLNVLPGSIGNGSQQSGF